MRTWISSIFHSLSMTCPPHASSLRTHFECHLICTVLFSVNKGLEIRLRAIQESPVGMKLYVCFIFILGQAVCVLFALLLRWKWMHHMLFPGSLLFPFVVQKLAWIRGEHNKSTTGIVIPKPHAADAVTCMPINFGSYTFLINFSIWYGRQSMMDLMYKST